MKKIISLVLAVLMLCTLAVSVGAAGQVYTIQDLMDYYKFVNSDYNPLAGITDNMTGIYNWFYDSCPECSGFCFYYIRSNKVIYQCLESKCGDTGSYEVETDKDEDDDIAIDDEKSIDCPKCTRDAYYTEKFYSDGKLYYTYECRNGHETNVKVFDFAEDWDDAVLHPIVCTDCTRFAEFDQYYTIDNYLYARYICPLGHKTYRNVSDSIDEWEDWYDWNDYKVTVNCTSGGTYEIENGHYADYGDYKTISFRAYSGYVLTGVTVNGYAVDVDDDDELTIRVYGDTAVRATFQKKTYLYKYDVETEVTGKGTVTATYNGKSVDPDEITVAYGAKITYKFTPADGYRLSSVKVNGKSVGTNAAYTLSNITDDTTVEVKFAWKNPYSDVSDKYLSAVEYVTEAGVMSATGKSGNKQLFSGTETVTVGTFAATLAELADTADKLDTHDERLEWAEKYDLIDDDTKLTAKCTVQAACALVDAYLEALEGIHDVEFDDFSTKNSAKDNAIAIGMVTKSIYEKDRTLCRYDLASVCKLIANLEYDD